MNKYYRILDKILATGKTQTNKKGNIQYLLNEQLSLTPADLLDIFEGHNIARKKLRSELQLFMQGERNVEKYREAGINWWDYCGSILVNSYPTYFEKLPPLIAKINRERRNSKNYVLFLGETGAESNQAPCLSLVQFQLDGGELVLSAYQRSSDANLGLPSDIYHLYLMARQIEMSLPEGAEDVIERWTNGRIKFRADVLRRKLPAEADELDRRCAAYVTDSELSLFVGVRLLRILGRLPEHVLCTLEACESLNNVQRNPTAHQLHAVTDEDIKRACVDGNQKAYGADELVRIFGGMLEKAYPEVCDKELFTVYDRCGDHISQRL